KGRRTLPQDDADFHPVGNLFELRELSSCTGTKRRSPRMDPPHSGQEAHAARISEAPRTALVQESQGVIKAAARLVKVASQAGFSRYQRPTFSPLLQLLVR